MSGTSAPNAAWQAEATLAVGVRLAMGIPPATTYWDGDCGRYSLRVPNGTATLEFVAQTDPVQAQGPAVGYATFMIRPTDGEWIQPADGVPQAETYIEVESPRSGEWDFWLWANGLLANQTVYVTVAAQGHGDPSTTIELEEAPNFC